MVRNRTPFIERSAKDVIERNERRSKLAEKHKNPEEDKELTFQPNLQ